MAPIEAILSTKIEDNTTGWLQLQQFYQLKVWITQRDSSN